MGLLEESAIILKADEKVTKRGKCKRFGEPKLLLRLDTGAPKAETTQFEVDQPSEWVEAIMNFVFHAR